MRRLSKRVARWALDVLPCIGVLGGLDVSAALLPSIAKVCDRGMIPTGNTGNAKDHETFNLTKT